MYVSEDVRIRGCFSKPERACEQKGLGNTVLHASSVLAMPGKVAGNNALEIVFVRESLLF
jgi:hypothetical protein